MRIENLVINCTARYPRTCRRTPFEVVVYELNYSSEDKDLMDLLRTKAEGACTASKSWCCKQFYA